MRLDPKKENSFPVARHLKDMYYRTQFCLLLVKTANSKWFLRARVEKGKQLPKDIQRGALARATITAPVPIPKAAPVG